MWESSGFVPVHGKNRVISCICVDFSFNWMFLLKRVVKEMKTKGDRNKAIWE